MDNNPNTQPEPAKIVKTAWIFDVNGVIVDPQEKKITEPKILDHIVDRLKLGEPVALNTGKSLIWTMERVVSPLLKRTGDGTILANLFVSGEKGSMRIVFNEKGEMERHKDETVSIPKDLQKKVKHLVDTEFSASMFYDDTKETLMTIEMRDNYPFDEFSKRQEILAEKLRELLRKNDPDELLRIDITTNAIDIENIHLGKGFAIERILKWLEGKNIMAQRFVVMADSYSDFSMPEKLNDLGKRVDFVYLGKNPVNQLYPFPVIRPKGIFGKGAIEALEFYKN